MTFSLLGEESFICGVCNRKIKKNNFFITCSLCNNKIHRKCNNYDIETYEQINKNPNNQIFCIKCKEHNIPFQKLPDQQFQIICETGLCKDIDHLNITIGNNYYKKYFNDINNMSISSDGNLHPMRLNWKLSLYFLICPT